MIPKIIHYTWFSGDEFPPKIQACVNSWKKYLPDYELRLWDMESIKNIDSDFLKEAIQCKKWAFAADYVRLYAIHHFGGIYLDTDVMIYKSFDHLLNNHAFIGAEHSIHFEGGMTERYLTSHCFGGIKNHPYFTKCLKYFKDRKFVESEVEDLPNTLRFRMVLLPYIQSEIAKAEGYDPSALKDEIQITQSGLVIYPFRYFDITEDTPDAIAKHLAVGAWREYDQYNPVASLSYKIQWRWQHLISKLLGKKYAVIRLH